MRHEGPEAQTHEGGDRVAKGKWGEGKSETRNPNPESSPKPECPKQGAGSRGLHSVIWASVIDSGIRVSEFGFNPRLYFLPLSAGSSKISWKKFCIACQERWSALAL